MVVLILLVDVELIGVSDVVIENLLPFHLFQNVMLICKNTMVVFIKTFWKGGGF